MTWETIYLHFSFFRMPGLAIKVAQALGIATAKP
jgi:hypothetical protein